MKKLFFLLLTLAAFSSAQAQEEVRKYRLEGGPDTFYVVDSSTRLFPGGERVVDEVWRPVIGKDSLKNYIAHLEKVATKAEEQADELKLVRQAAKKEVKRIRAELNADKPGTGRTVLQTPQGLDVPSSGYALPPGEYIFDGNTFTPKAKVEKVKKAPTPKKEKG
jgi:hypothetical protein